jgi:hypothetical protein
VYADPRAGSRRAVNGHSAAACPSPAWTSRLSPCGCGFMGVWVWISGLERGYRCGCVYMCVGVCVCVWVCVYVCGCMYVCGCVYMGVNKGVGVGVNVGIWVWIRAWV